MISSTSNITAMTYNIIGIFPTIDEATSAAAQLTKAGYIREFVGFAMNTKIYPESLIEDHFIDQNEISVYTPNLNRAHKAKNILKKFGAAINKAPGISLKKATRKIQSHSSLILAKKRKATKKLNFKNE